jgi:hemoglobin
MPPAFRRAGVIAASAILLGCVAARDGDARAAESLYARMGGEPVVQAVVSDTLDRVTADPRLERSFDGVNMRRLKRLLAEQICELSGGGCHYSGDPMREVHAGLHISEAEFYGLVQILRDSLRRHQVHLRERNELLALLAPMKRDVVEESAPPRATGN